MLSLAGSKQTADRANEASNVLLQTVDRCTPGLTLLFTLASETLIHEEDEQTVCDLETVCFLSLSVT